MTHPHIQAAARNIAERDRASKLVLEQFATQHGLEFREGLWSDVLQKPEPRASWQGQDMAMCAHGSMPGGRSGFIAYVSRSMSFVPVGDADGSISLDRYLVAGVEVRCTEAAHSITCIRKTHGEAVATWRVDHRKGVHRVPASWKPLKRHFHLRAAPTRNGPALPAISPVLAELMCDNPLGPTSYELLGPMVCVSVPEVLHDLDANAGARHTFSHGKYPDADYLAAVIDHASVVAAGLEATCEW